MNVVSAQTPERIKIMLVDDQPIVREEVRLYLARYPHLEVVGEASGGEEAIAMARLLKPSFVFMDISMIGLDGIEATKRLLHEHPEIAVVALTIHSDPDNVREMRMAGAKGYLLKTDPPSGIARAIERIQRDKAGFVTSPGLGPMTGQA